MQTENVDGKFVGSNINGNYTIEDDSAALLHAIWQANNQSTIVNAVLSNTDLWGSDITKLNGFEEAVNHYLQSLAVNPTATIEQLILK
jgi:tagaturonate reductase